MISQSGRKVNVRRYTCSALPCASPRYDPPRSQSRSGPDPWDGRGRGYRPGQPLRQASPRVVEFRRVVVFKFLRVFGSKRKLTGAPAVRARSGACRGSGGNQRKTKSRSHLRPLRLDLGFYRPGERVSRMVGHALERTEKVTSSYPGPSPSVFSVCAEMTSIRALCLATCRRRSGYRRTTRYASYAA
jgi:hypothetical protein